MNKNQEEKNNEEELTLGERVADKFASVVGSWTFILIQTFFLFLWISINAFAFWNQWDPYPFILLNLFLSFQAAYTGPLVMMSQNRQTKIDRETMRKDYELSEDSLAQIEIVAKIVKSFDKDRNIQIKLLKHILEEMEDENEDN